VVFNVILAKSISRLVFNEADQQRDNAAQYFFACSEFFRIQRLLQEQDIQTCCTFHRRPVRNVKEFALIGHGKLRVSF
jgi:hypothetical protein